MPVGLTLYLQNKKKKTLDLLKKAVYHTIYVNRNLFDLSFFVKQIVMNTINGRILLLKKLSFIFALILGASIFLTGCKGDNSTANTQNENQLSIYTTVYPLEYMAKQIGGDYVNVSSIYPAGVDEHTFEPTQKDIINIAESDLFYYIGYNLEGFANNVTKTLANENVEMVAIGEKVELDAHEHEEEGHEHEDHEHEDDGHDHGSVDPHLWIDPLYAKEMAKHIKDSLIEKMPEQESTFEENYQVLSQKFDELNTEYTNVFSEAQHKEFLVSHAAFGYWEERYDVEQISVSGLSTSEEPTQKSLENLVDTAKEHELKYILVEQNVNSKLTDIIQKEAKLTSLPIHNLSILTQDDIEKGRDYFSIAKDNLDSLQKALND